MFNVKKSMGSYLIGALLGLLAGTLLFFVQPVQWKGQALVRIGQYTQSQNQNQNTYAIEPLSTVIERLNTRSFLQAVAKRANRNEILALLSVEGKGGMTVKPIRNSDSLIITVVGGSADLVQASIDSVVAELLSKHDAILNTYETDIRKELSGLDSEIDALKKRLAMVLDGQMVAIPKTVEEREVVTGFWLMAIQQDLDYKLNRASHIRESISSTNIFPTSLIEPVSISEQHIFSSLWRACLFGALAGIFLSLILIQWRKK